MRGPSAAGCVRLAVVAATSFLLAATPACVCGSTAQLKETGDLSEKNSNTQVGCSCIIKGERCVSDLQIDMALCLPAELNPAIGAGGLDDLAWQDGVRNYCRTRMASNVKKMAQAFSKKICDGGDENPDSDGCLKTAEIICDLQPLPGGRLAVAANPTCNATCEAIPCAIVGTDPRSCESTKIVNDDDPDGVYRAHPELCKCTQALPQRWGAQCGVTEPSEVYCFRPPGNQDPPTTIRSGQLTALLSGPHQIQLDPAQSALTLTVEFSDSGNDLHASTQRIPVSGSVILYGRCDPGRNCDVLFDMTMFADPATFHYEDVTFGFKHFDQIDVTQSRMAIVAGMGPIYARVDATGAGLIPANTLSVYAEAIISGVPGVPTKRRIYEAKNTLPLSFLVDFQAKTFRFINSSFTFDDGRSSLTLLGTIVNQPPRVDAGPPQVVECTAPGEALLTLRGSASDRDNNILAYEWWRDAPMSGEHVGSGDAVEVKAPYLPPRQTTQYALQVIDTRLTASTSTTSVTVQDTTPPVLDLALSPECLWSPNHGMVLYELGRDLQARATDACDAAPELRIIDVRSNQPSLGGGSGNTDPDVLFGESAFCVRAERAGTSKTDREYIATVQARDATGNLSTKEVAVHVQHDQGGAKCTKVDPDRIVDDADPRCTETRRGLGLAHDKETPMAVAERPVAAPAQAAPPGAREASSPACSFAPGPDSRSAPVWLVAVTVLCALCVRRRRDLLAARSLVALAAVLGLTCFSCGRDSSAPESNLETRASGWWIDPQAGGCYCPQQAECGGGDCAGYSVLGLLPDKRYFGGQIAVSRAAGTLSSVGAVATGTWRSTAQEVTVSQPKIDDMRLAVKVDGDRMNFGPQVLVRAPADMTAALARASESGSATWKTVPLQR